MICEQMFRLKKNGEPYCNCFCRHPELIENYDKAMADTTQVWECHHRLETHNSDGEERLVPISKAELEALDIYFDRPPEELIFLIQSEHTGLHTRLRNQNTKGRTLSKETKRRISNAMKCRTFSEETKRKMSEARKAYWERKATIGNL